MSKIGRNQAQEECLQNFQAQISQFPIKAGPNELVLLDYFRKCPRVQELTYPWHKISCELLALSSYNKAMPHWVCSHYDHCEFNVRCSAPFRKGDKHHLYQPVTEHKFVPSDLDAAEKREDRFVEKPAIGQFLISCNNKVLVSPECLVAARGTRKYSQDQVANMCGLTKQAISNLEKTLEAPTHKLNCIATDNKMITMKYSLCCLLATLYEVTPGYLMGHSDDVSQDVYVTHIAYYEREHIVQKGLKAVCLYDTPVREEFEVSRLSIPVMLFSGKKRKGRKAADDIRAFKDGSDYLMSNVQELVEVCERIYYHPIPGVLQTNLRQLFDGLLDSPNTSESK